MIYYKQYKNIDGEKISFHKKQLKDSFLLFAFQVSVSLRYTTGSHNKRVKEIEDDSATLQDVSVETNVDLPRAWIRSL